MAGPFIVAVAGGSGSGKTTFVKLLAESLAPYRPVVISIDNYYRDLSKLDRVARDAVNFDDPKAIEQDLLADQIRQLRGGQTIAQPQYDFVTHCRHPKTQSIEPSQIIILDGIFALCFEEIYDALDLKLYVDVDVEYRLIRRLSRDIKERGRSLVSCSNQYLNSVKDMHYLHIEPSRSKADLVIPWFHYNHKAVALIARMIKSSLQNAD